jgi:hypothetical protein
MSPFAQKHVRKDATNRLPMITSAAAILMIGGFLFYWYELRPIQIYRMCTQQASVDARNLLKSKADLAGDTTEGAQYKSLMEKNMYLRSDYNSFLQKCLLYYGRPVPTESAPSDS